VNDFRSQNFMPPREKAPHSIDSAPQYADIIDVADGIDRLMGNRDLYARMIERFRSDYRDGVAPVRAALAAGDRTLAHRRIHTLKGSSGMIGAHRLHQAACALEVAIRTDPGAEQACLADMVPEFDKVLAGLDRLLAGAVVAQPRPVLPRALLQDSALLAQLVDLLLAGDGAAVDLLEESGASLKVILGDARLAQVAAAVNEFDFEGALRALRQTVQEQVLESTRGA
jgi:HPt (histidine-containing phosphotransfer) domain-containing protein